MSFISLTNLGGTLNLPNTSVSNLGVQSISNGIVTSSNGSFSSIPAIDVSNLSNTLQTRLNTIETNVTNLGNKEITDISGVYNKISLVDSSINTLSVTVANQVTDISGLKTNISVIDSSINTLSDAVLNASTFTLDETVGLIESTNSQNSINFAQNWNKLINSPSDNGIGVGSSANGRYILKLGWGAPCYLSNDFGNTWNTVSSLGYYSSLCSMSANGQYIAVIGSPNLLSNDFGNTWGSFPNVNGTFSDATVSATGKYIIVSTSNGIFYSSNYGQSFSKYNDDNLSGSYNVDRVAISKDGTIAYANVTRNSPTRATIWKTNNSGESWSKVFDNSLNTNLGQVSCSGDGKYVLISITQGNSDYPYLSSDYGNTFTALSSNGLSSAPYFKSAVSSNGQYMILVCNSGRAYTSTNYGVSWTQTPLPSTNYYGVSMSENASLIYAYAPGDQLYSYNANISSILTSQPTNPGQGGLYFDESNNKLYVWNSTSSAWKSITLA